MSIRKLNPRQGFTLIEILVVMIIILIVTTFAVLAIGDGGKARRVKYFAQNLVVLLNYADEYAILTPAQLRFMIRDHQYGFQQLSISHDPKGYHTEWQSPSHRLLQWQHIPTFAIVSLSSPVLITENGSVTPFQLNIAVRHSSIVYVIHGNRAGAITLTEKHQ